MKNLLMVIVVLIGCMHNISAMNKERCTEEKSDIIDKIHLIRDTFTTERAWDWALSLSFPNVTYRKATREHRTYQTPFATTELVMDYKEKTTPVFFVMPTVVLKDYLGKSFVGCENGSLCTIIMKQDGSKEYVHYPQCHNASITSLHPISDDWIAIGGGQSVTFYPLSPEKKKVRITPFANGTITNINIEYGALIITKSYVDQIICYPYSKSVWKFLRGIGTRKEEIDLLFNAAVAVYKERAFSLNSDDVNTYARMPSDVTNIISQHVLSMEMI